MSRARGEDVLLWDAVYTESSAPPTPRLQRGHPAALDKQDFGEQESDVSRVSTILLVLWGTRALQSGHLKTCPESIGSLRGALRAVVGAGLRRRERLTYPPFP